MFEARLAVLEPCRARVEIANLAAVLAAQLVVFDSIDSTVIGECNATKQSK